MFGDTGIIMPISSNIYLILVDIWANFGQIDWLRAARLAACRNGAAIRSH